MNQPQPAALVSLGSNLGDRAATLDAALAALDATPGVRVMATSRVHETRPSGGPAGQGAFLNAAAALEFAGSPEELLAILQRVETEAGRVRQVRWGARTLDLDLLLFGLDVIQTPTLTVPHPLMAVRRFVLAPLAEVAPGAIHPSTGRAVADLLANLDRRPIRVALVDPDPTRRRAICDRLDTGIVQVSDADPTFRLVVAEPLSMPDGTPTIPVEPNNANAIAAYVAAILDGIMGA